MHAVYCYTSDSSSSQSDVSEREAPPAKRRRHSSTPPSQPASPPPPSSLLPSAEALLDGSYSPPPAHQQRQLEQAALHQGRTRAFPHVTGNFAAHVFVAVDTPPACLEALEALLQLLCTRLPSLQPALHAASGAEKLVSLAAAGAAATCSPTTAPPAPLAQLQYHISLSRTVALRLEEIEPLVAELRSRLRQQETFCIRMGRPEVFANDDRSRTFLALRACGGGGGSGEVASSRGPASGSAASQQATSLEQQQERQQQQQQQYSSQLVALSQAVSQSFAAHGLPRFYDDPRPHASVAWLLGDHWEALEAVLTEPEVQMATGRLAAHSWQLLPAVVVCKAGQREHAVWKADGSSSGSPSGCSC